MVNSEEEGGRNGNGEQKWRECICWVRPLVLSNFGRKVCKIKPPPFYSHPTFSSPNPRHIYTRVRLYFSLAFPSWSLLHPTSCPSFQLRMTLWFTPFISKHSILFGFRVCFHIIHWNLLFPLFLLYLRLSVVFCCYECSRFDLQLFSIV